MKTSLSTLLLICSVITINTLAQQHNIITASNNPKGWIIKTNSSSYQIIVDTNGNVKPAYYGRVEQADFGVKNAAWYEGINEVPVRGGYPFKTPMLEVVFSDNVRDADLIYVSGEIVTIDARSTLKITQKDKFYPLEVISYIRVLPEFDILEKWSVIRNTGKNGNIKIENMQSGSIVLPPDEYVLTHLSGKQLHEFQLQEASLTPGLMVLQSKAFKANANPPWFMVRPKSQDKENGAAWFGSLHYSGNWQLAFDKTFEGPLQIFGGINFWDTEWRLEPGKSFETPKLSVGFTTEGADGVSRRLSAYVKNDILPATHRNDLRPIIYNSWEATYYNVNEQQQIKLAKIASELGIELFSIDDGWFRERTDGRSQSGLGNWDVDKNKFPNGLAPVIKQVHDLGMKFGLWIEPENVNPNSDVYKAHPQWTFQVNHRKGNPFRKILNLANEDAYQYLLQTFTTLLKNHDIDFIKWDQNNYLSEPGWETAPADIQREARIRHVSNVYRLVEELRKRFPKVLFESCASGGGRVDLGMLSRMDQAWVSDNTDPIDRLYIQYGYLSALPAKTMVSWVTGANRHQPTSLAFKFDVSMSGVLGVGDDITKWNEDDKAVARKKISEYKAIRPIIQDGITYRLISPYEQNRCAIQYTKPDTTVVMCYNLAEYLPGSQFITRGSSALKLKGLQGDKMYTIKKVEDADTNTGTTYKGDFLMNIGIAWTVKGANNSQILLVTAVR